MLDCRWCMGVLKYIYMDVVDVCYVLDVQSSNHVFDPFTNHVVYHICGRSVTNRIVLELSFRKG